MTDADKERSPKDESNRLLKVAATCLFYARAYPSDWGVFRRFARSAIRGTPSPAQRGSTHRFPRYCTAEYCGRVGSRHFQNPSSVLMKGSLFMRMRAYRRAGSLLRNR